MSERPNTPRLRPTAPAAPVRRPHGARSRIVAGAMSAMSATGLVVWMAQRAQPTAVTATSAADATASANATPPADATASASAQGGDDNSAQPSLPPVTVAPKQAIVAPQAGLPTRSLTRTRGS